MDDFAPATSVLSAPYKTGWTCAQARFTVRIDMGVQGTHCRRHTSNSSIRIRMAYRCRWQLRAVSLNLAVKQQRTRSKRTCDVLALNVACENFSGKDDATANGEPRNQRDSRVAVHEQ
jgi:hypothetical protein